MRHICTICKKVIKTTTKKGRKPVYFPFCSERCKLIDLGAWFDGKYRISNRAGRGDLSQNIEKSDIEKSEKNQATTGDSDKR